MVAVLWLSASAPLSASHLSHIGWVLIEPTLRGLGPKGVKMGSPREMGWWQCCDAWL